jgi:hypothetical protein
LWRQLLILSGFLLIAGALCAQRSVNPPEPVTSWDGQKASYSSTFSGASVAGDTVVLTGSASRTIRVTRVNLSGCTISTAAYVTVNLNKHTTADTAGTTAAMTTSLRDSNDAAASATITGYSVAPTAGTSTTAAILRIFASTTTTVGTSPQFYIFGLEPGSRAIVLRGTTQQFAVNFGTAAVTCGITVVWTEE